MIAPASPQLYENNCERAYGFISRRIHDRQQAQDLTADVFHNALKNLGHFANVEEHLLPHGSIESQPTRLAMKSRSSLRLFAS